MVQLHEAKILQAKLSKVCMDNCNSIIKALDLAICSIIVFISLKNATKINHCLSHQNTSQHLHK